MGKPRKAPYAVPRGVLVTFRSPLRIASSSSPFISMWRRTSCSNSWITFPPASVIHLPSLGTSTSPPLAMAAEATASCNGVTSRHASHPHGGIVVGIGAQGQNLSISRIQGYYSRGTGFLEPPRMSPVQPFLNGLFYRCLQICINRQNQVPAGSRLHHAPYTLRSTYSINLNLPRATFAPEKRVIRSLHTVLSHTLAGMESPKLLSLQLLG